MGKRILTVLFLLAALVDLSAQVKKSGALYECDVELENSLTLPSIHSRATGIGTRHIFLPLPNSAFWAGLGYRYHEFAPQVSQDYFSDVSIDPSSFQCHHLMGSLGVQFRFNDIRKLRKSLWPYLSLGVVFPMTRKNHVFSFSGVFEKDGKTLLYEARMGSSSLWSTLELGTAFRIGNYGDFYFGLDVEHCFFPNEYSGNMGEDEYSIRRRIPTTILVKIGKRFTVHAFSSHSESRVIYRAEYYEKED